MDFQSERFCKTVDIEIVLFSEDFGRGHKCCLIAAFDCTEHRDEGHDRLA